jgi:Transposase, Mutator family
MECIGLPALRAPGASVPDGRTIRRNRSDPSRTSAPPILIPVTNPLERLNKEVKRRADVVGIFPNEESITRLIGAVLMEANDEWQLQQRLSCPRFLWTPYCSEKLEDRQHGR